MKKIFYILASAIVALGAVACDNQDVDNITPAGEGLTIFATIDDETRVAFESNNAAAPKWEENEIINIEGFDFTHQGNGQFICTTTGVENALCDGYEKTATAGTFDSTAGLKGSTWKAQSVITKEGTTLEFKLTTALLKFKAEKDETVTFKGSNNLFSAASINITATGEEQFIAINPVTATLSYEIDEVECNKKEGATFEVKKIYNLGTLYGPSDWEISDKTRFFKTATTDLFVAKNVKLAANNFCIHKVGDTAWGAGAKYGLVTAGTKSENTAIGLYSANWSGDITISNASTTAHDIYFDKANSRVYVMTVGKDIKTATIPTHSNWYNIAGTMNSWGSSLTDAQKFTYCGDNVWHLIIDFKANDEFKVQLKNGWSTCYGYNQIQSGVGRDLSNGSGDDNTNAKIKADGTYEIWVVPSHGDVPLYIIKK